MLIVVQFPFIDLGKIKNEIPDSSSGSKQDYYRYFGSRRKRGDHDSLSITESEFYKANRNIFHSLDNLKDKDLKLEVMFNRLYKTGFFFHFDIIIGVTGGTAGKDPQKIVTDLIKNGKFTTRYIVSKKREKNPAPLGNRPQRHFDPKLSFEELRQQLAALYIQAEKGRTKREINAADIHWGDPVILCQSGEEATVNDRIRDIPNEQGIALRKSYFKDNSQYIHLWFMQKEIADHKKKRELRAFRVSLLSMHNYREGLIKFFENSRKLELAQLDLALIKDEFELLRARLEQKACAPHKDYMNIAAQIDAAVFSPTWKELEIKIQRGLTDIDNINALRDKIQAEGGKTVNNYYGPVGSVFQGDVTVSGGNNNFGLNYGIIKNNYPQITEAEYFEIKKFFESFDSTIAGIEDEKVKAQLLENKALLEEDIKNGEKKSKIENTFTTITKTMGKVLKETAKFVVNNPDKVTKLLDLAIRILRIFMK